MSENVENIAGTDDDLDAFAADFFGQKEAPTEPASSEKPLEDDPKDSDAPEEENHSDEDLHEDDEDIENSDGSEDSDESNEDSEDDPKPEPKKKNRFQERIDELSGKYREEERQRLALQAQIDALTKKLSEQQEAAPKQIPETQTSNSPDPTDLNDDGTDKYPLGEFDPKYIRDLHRHIANEEHKAIEARAQEERAKQEQDQKRAQTITEWNGKLETAKERYPDLEEKGNVLVNSFQNLDPTYGEYLSQTIMTMDYGPDVLYYLSNNPDIAKKIVDSGYQKATLTLGQISAKFADAEAEQTKARPRVSKAPTPPPANKGSSAAKVSVSADTDDLDAFESVFFKK